MWLRAKHFYLARVLKTLSFFFVTLTNEKIRASDPKNNKEKEVPKKTIFVAFAIEDERQRDFLRGQSLHTQSPFEYIDMSVKKPYDSDWKTKVRTRIRRSGGVIALVSHNSLDSSGQIWEINCAKEESKQVLGIWAYRDDRTNLSGIRQVKWNWETIEAFINSL